MGALALGVFLALSPPLERSRQQIELLVSASGAEVAIAFRTLDGRDEFLREGGASFHAASTMKIPVMIELFAQAKAGTLGLDDSLPVKNEFQSIVDQSLYKLDPDDDADADVYKAQTLTLRQLCQSMIRSSSNLATNLLMERLGISNIRAQVHALGADGMEVIRGVEDSKAFMKGLNNTTTAIALLKLLEALAEGTAVDKASSQAMVEILKGQEHNEAIPAGLPPGTPVAHKTGEVTKIHHDAAIVYAPRPFILVLLVRGIEDQKESAALMAAITRSLYDASQETPRGVQAP
jgi:beta-lactamase class A